MGWYEWNRETDETTAFPDYPLGSIEWLEQTRGMAERLSDVTSRRVDEHSIAGFWISTVFLGLDRRFGQTSGWDEGPILFETMIWDEAGRAGTIYMDRYRTASDARAAHNRLVRWISQIIAFSMTTAPLGRRSDLKQIINRGAV